MVKHNLEIKIIENKKIVDQIVHIHMETFTGFFLTFLGRGFLHHLYKGFITHDKSNIIGAFEEDKLLGFLAYSEDISGFYKYLIKKSLVPFAWYSFLAFLRRPKVMTRLLRAFIYSKESNNGDTYIELSSIGVLPMAKSKGIGTMLISKLKDIVDFRKYEYIKLETDKLNNDPVNFFYLKNGFKISRSFRTHEGREMNEYIYI